MNNNHQHLSCF